MLMDMDSEQRIKSMERELKLLRKKISRSEANRALAEKMKDETDILYENVLDQIAQQKLLLEESQDNLNDAFDVITSSINYAARIQRSVLPNTSALDAILTDHFIYWEPRDTVGGDIYWFDIWGDGILVILGDCTGHGVPGAFMTLIASGALDRAKAEVDAGDVSSLVQRMHQFMQITLRQHTDGSEANDGMELGALYIDMGTEKLRFVGARFDLFISDGTDVAEIKGARRGLGYFGIPWGQTYETHEIDTKPGTSYYLTSDGYTDQVGGENRRMFGKKRFKALLASFYTLPMAEQKTRLYEALAQYQGKEERRDDVSIIGLTP